MKRTTTLLALVALVLASLLLHSLQAPTRAPRWQGRSLDSAAADINSGACDADRAVPSAMRTALIPPDCAHPSQCAEKLPSTVEATETTNGPLEVGVANWPTEGPTIGPDCEDAGHDEPPRENLPACNDSDLDKKRKYGNSTLNWLRDHQCEDGRWSASDFGAASARKDAHHSYNVEFFAPGLEWGDKGQSPDNDMAVTALVLLAHLGTGYDHKDGDYKEGMRRALKWMRAQQNENGRFGPEHDNAFLPTHALCTAAMAECFGLSGDAALKDNCERAARHLLTLQPKDSGFARNPNGWGLEAEPDVATTAWSVLALKTARIGGIELDLAASAAGVLSFLDTVTDCVKDTEGKITDVRTRLRERGGEAPDYREGSFVSMPTLNAMNALCRVILGDSENQTDIGKALAISAIMENAAWSERQVDFLHFYFASAAAYQWLGSSFRRVRKTGPDKGHSEWELTLVKTLNDNQRGYRPDELKTGPAMLDEFGSWDAVDAYSRQGGRVYTTAMAALCLQIYYRYKRQTKD